MDWRLEYLGAFLLVMGAVLRFRIRRAKFERINEYGVERFSSYWNKLRSRTKDGMLGGLSILLLSSGVVTLAFRYQESWGWLVLFPFCLVMLFALIGV